MISIGHRRLGFELGDDFYRSDDHEAGAGFLDIPVAGDLHRIVLGEDRIEDRLLGEPRRKRLEAGLPDELQLLRADWAEEDRSLHRSILIQIKKQSPARVAPDRPPPSALDADHL